MRNEVNDSYLEQQQIFLDYGLLPRGYVPSWKYNKKCGCFEDRILFNCCERNIDTQIVVYEENKPLLETLGFSKN